MGTAIPAPKNKAIEVVKIILEKLIEGVGVDLTIAAATAELPWLGAPVVKTLFRWAVEWLAGYINDNLFKISLKLIIRVQSDARKAEFNEAIQPIIGGNPSAEDIEKARRAADRLIERNR